uniref:Mediator of RNA polymerase II transcription subunit 28 n=1 Tax=Anopheles farauti TaxID=69004 RepID=A0A182QE87_9DIPT
MFAAVHCIFDHTKEYKFKSFRYYFLLDLPKSQVAEMASSSNGSGNLVDELEEAFQSCIHALTKEESATGIDKDEIKVEVDQTTLKFIDLARQMEAFFLQKRFLLSALKPDLLLKEENFDLKQEIGRKDELIRKHYEKIESWKQLLSDQQNFSKPIQTMPPDMRGNLAGGAPGGPPGLMGSGPNLQGPLAYLEKTASNIGEPTVRIGPTATVSLVDHECGVILTQYDFDFQI